MIETGQILNNTYRIESRIGSGGGGIVFKAYHLRLEKYVAVKLIKEEIRGAVNERAEADILKKLKHEGLPQVYDFITDGSDVYTVMEYIDGCSLFDEIVKRGKISYRQSLEWSKQLCAAAAYLHTRKPPIIHSDIKPQNIMITSEGKVCLIDFNISSIFGGGVYTVGSSDGYSPPEQYLARADKSAKTSVCRDTQLLIDDDATEILDDKTEIFSEMQENGDRTEDVHTTDNTILDARSDVYSIGAVMYSMITGMKPNNSRKSILPLKKINEDTPEPLIFIIEKAMSKDKKDRFPSAAEMFKALENIGTFDRRYKMMNLRHTAAYCLAVLFLAGSAVSAIAGRRLMQKESDERYAGYITELSEMNISKDYSDFDAVYSALADEFQITPELEFYRAAKMYDENDIEGSQSLLEDNIIPNIRELPDSLKTTAYYMEADILFGKEEYEAAAGYYERSAAAGNDSADMFRDYAVCLARAGDTQKAENILETAKSYGITEDGIYMVTGEIQFMRGEYPESVSSLKKAAEVTKDNILKQNAYLVCSKAYSEQYSTGGEEIFREHIAMLENAVDELPEDMTMQLREYLAQGYIDYAEKCGKYEYYEKAVMLLNDMRKLGWSNYQTEMNIAVLCDRIGDTHSCRNLLLEMAQVEEYSPYYFTIYVRLAYCEADIQSKKEGAERDYSDFDRYYSEAAEQYEIYTENGNTDPEMDKLTQYRNELVRLGWLE